MPKIDFTTPETPTTEQIPNSGVLIELRYKTNILDAEQTPKLNVRLQKTYNDGADNLTGLGGTIDAAVGGDPDGAQIPAPLQADLDAAVLKVLTWAQSVGKLPAGTVG